jgi:AbrB family looped-hinge helix DNA binding protein
MQYTSTMTSKGQVTVPAAIRRKLGLKPGQQVRFVFFGGKVRLENDNWREELESLGSQVRESMQANGLKPLSDNELQQARQAAQQAAADNRKINQ